MISAPWITSAEEAKPEAAIQNAVAADGHQGSGTRGRERKGLVQKL